MPAAQALECVLIQRLCVLGMDWAVGVLGALLG